MGKNQTQRCFFIKHLNKKKISFPQNFITQNGNYLSLLQLKKKKENVVDVLTNIWAFVQIEEGKNWRNNTEPLIFQFKNNGIGISILKNGNFRSISFLLK